MILFTGFNEGYIQYDDTKIPSDFYGILPDGQFSRDARFYFCCRGDGKTKTPITLPSEEPFILFADTSSCQKVSGSVVFSYLNSNSWKDVNNDKCNRTTFHCFSILNNFLTSLILYQAYGFMFWNNISSNFAICRNEGKHAIFENKKQ